MIGRASGPGDSGLACGTASAGKAPASCSRASCSDAANCIVPAIASRLPARKLSLPQEQTASFKRQSCSKHCIC